MIAATIIIAACGGSDDATDTATAEPPVASDARDAADDVSAPAPANPDANPALQFTAAQVGGGSIDVSELGDKPVLFWFWAPW